MDDRKGKIEKMGILELNETPVRTSKNFNINNIKLKDIIIPEDIEEFNGLEIINKTENVKIFENEANSNLIYGVGKIFTNQNLEKSNKNLKLIIDNKNVETKGKKNEHIQLNFYLDNRNLNLFENLEIIANKDANANWVIKYKSNDNDLGFHNGIIKVLAKENSNIKITIINLLNTNSNNFISIQNDLERNSNINYTIIDFGGSVSITNYYSNIIGENANNELNTIYLGKESQIFDLNYIAELKGEKTNINIDVQGALKDNAKKHFKGTIDFKKGAKKATGNENEYCMLLSDTAKSIALPMLLCSEEDVLGNHSSAAGKVGKKELFYIMSRGFTLKQALKLMVRARFNKVLDKIEDEKIKEEILQEIEDKLD